MPFLIAFGLALVAIPLCLVGGRASGLVDRPSGDGLKIHDRPVPDTGGVAVSVAALAGMAVGGHVPWWLSAAVGAAVLLGTVDDARSLPPWVRLAGQAGIGALVAAGGLRLEPLGMLGSVGVVVAVVACTNAVNLMDGQDALAGGLAAIAAAGLAMFLPAGGPGRALALATVGALAAFLLWNRPPARIFLGNGGAYALGTVLAVLAVGVGRSGWPQLLAAIVCLGVFAVELVSTTVRRLRADRSPLMGDREHAYDVAARALGRTGSTILFWGLGAASAGVALVIHDGSPVIATGIAIGYMALSIGGSSIVRRRGRHLATEETA